MNEEDAAEALVVAVGDPATLAQGVEVVDEVGGDAGDEGLETFVPAILFGVEEAVTLDDPAHVSGAVGPEDIRWRWPWRRVAEHGFDGGHGLDETGALVGGEWLDHLVDLLVGSLVQYCDLLLPRLCESEVGPSSVVGGGSALDEQVGFEGAEDAAEVADVEVERDGDLGGGGLVARGDLVEDAGFGEGERAIEEA